MRRLRRDEGVVMILVAVLLVVLLGMAGLAVDLGAPVLRAPRTAQRGRRRRPRHRRGLRAGRRALQPSAAEATAAQCTPTANSDDGASGVQVSLDSPADGTAVAVRVVTSAFDDEAGVAGVRVPLMSLFGLDRVDVTAAATAIFDHPVSGDCLAPDHRCLRVPQVGRVPPGSDPDPVLRLRLHGPSPWSGFG